MIDAILAKVCGAKNKREIKAIQPLIAAINDLEPAIPQLSRSTWPRKPSSSRKNWRKARPSTTC